jgi:hypothetical protein
MSVRINRETIPDGQIKTINNTEVFTSANFARIKFLGSHNESFILTSEHGPTHIEPGGNIIFDPDTAHECSVLIEVR